MSDQPFTPDQIANWHAYEEVRKDGKYNMFDPRARALTGLSGEEYKFVMVNYSALKAAAPQAMSTTNIIRARDVIRWLKTQPATRQFNYYDNCGCLFASFAKDKLRLKRESVTCRGLEVTVGNREYAVPVRTERAISRLETMFTAGEALKSLRKL